jgi:hypothetical protein
VVCVCTDGYYAWKRKSGERGGTLPARDTGLGKSEEACEQTELKRMRRSEIFCRVLFDG